MHTLKKVGKINKNGRALENYTELSEEIKEQIELISGNNVIKYSKDFKKIKFNSNDDLPLGKILNIHVCIIIVRSVFEEDRKYYPQVLLQECFYKYENNIYLPVVYSFNYSVNKSFSFF